VKSQHLTAPVTGLLLSLGLLASVSAQAEEGMHHEAMNHESMNHEAMNPDGQDPHAQHRAMLEKSSQESQGQSTQIKLSDRKLVNQSGEPVKFASDVVGQRIVVMDFVYTSCTTVCPVLSAILEQVQERLGERLGPEVTMVSISVDPTRDTPARLAAYAAKHQARDGWVWLTGEKPTVDLVLQDLGAYAPAFEDHPSMVLVGDSRSGVWTRYFGFPGPDQIMARVNELAAARQTAATEEK